MFSWCSCPDSEQTGVADNIKASQVKTWSWGWVGLKRKKHNHVKYKTQIIQLWAPSSMHACRLTNEKRSEKAVSGQGRQCIYSGPCTILSPWVCAGPAPSKKLPPSLSYKKTLSSISLILSCFLTCWSWWGWADLWRGSCGKELRSLGDSQRGTAALSPTTCRELNPTSRQLSELAREPLSVELLNKAAVLANGLMATPGEILMQRQSAELHSDYQSTETVR